MKKLISTIWGLTLLIFVNQVGATVMLSLEPSSQSAVPTDTVFLDLVIDGLGAGGPDSLGDFDIDIAYDPGALSFSSYSLGPSLGDLGLGEAIDLSFGDLGGGIVNVAELSLLLPFELDALQADMFTLASLEFSVDVLAVGASTAVSIDIVYALGDGFGLPLELTETAGAVIRNPSTKVPEPSMISLMLLGLAGFHIYRRRRA